MIPRLLIITFFAIAQTINLFAVEPEIKTELERDSALIGEQFEFRITILSDKSLHSIIPLDDKLFPGEIEVISEDSDSADTEPKEYFFQYTITAFDSGNFVINSIPVLVNDFSDLDTLFSQARELTFLMPEVDTTAAIKDIKDPINTPFQLKELLPVAPYMGGGLILVAIALLVYFFIYRKKKEAGIAVKSLPAHVRALQSLDRIKKEKLWQRGEVKEYYSQLSDTVRIYIEERFHIPAMESVTWEILDDFKKHAWDDEGLMELLESLLLLSDLVKFAKEDPTPAENETNLNNAYIFIEKTKEVVSPDQEENK
jgi:hypothetical protein